MKVLYILIIICMSAATFIEKYRGTDFVAGNIYGAWWFSALWAMLTAAATVYFIRRRVHRFSTVALHISFVVILTGALLTHLTAIRGVVQLREGRTTDIYLTTDGDNIAEHRLPFALRLDRFEVTYHEGGAAPADYISHVSIIGRDGKAERSDAAGGGAGSEKGMQATVSMNNILSHRGYRLYQSDYDRDMHGSTLALNSDPWGIPVTYLGYAMLFISFVWILTDPNATFRRLLRMSTANAVKTMAAMAVMCATADTATAAPVLPRETAGRFGELYILYKGRICPVETFAADFTKKLCGRTSYNGYSAEQVLTGFLLWGDEWSREPVIRMKGCALRERLMLPEYCSVSTFFNRSMGGYILGPYLREVAAGNNDRFHRDVTDTDDRLMLIMELRRGSLLKIFPYTADGRTAWYAPADMSAHHADRVLIAPDHRTYMQSVLPLLRSYADGNAREADRLISRMAAYQLKNSGGSLPSPVRVRAERIYNAVPFATILFMLDLTLGFIALFFEIKGGSSRMPSRILFLLMALSFAALTVCEALRWTVSGTVPLANGYETMLFVAWAVMLLSMIAAARFRIALTFGFIMSGLFLLVSHISQMDPDITHRMPVLNSPLLSIHVSVIMIAFALLALTFICGVTAIAITAVGRFRHAADTDAHTESLTLLSRLFLYPALAALATGIFVGAVWANVSWGQYWSWDPKEVWALITMMVYAVAAHTGSLPALRRPMAYHIFMTAAFITILITYFGVNYVLGGMHSYA